MVINDPLQLVIVRDMWLTRLDAPNCHTMYIDKPMKGHNLRMNRVFKDKPGGLVVEVEKQGTGKVVQKGKQVTVKYLGKLTNGKKFDSGNISFRLGAREVIKGWDMGVAGMKVGEKRKLIIPANLGMSFTCRMFLHFSSRWNSFSLCLEPFLKVCF